MRSTGKILIFGGNGFVGRYVIDAFSRRPEASDHELVVVGRAPVDLRLPDRIRFQLMNLSEPGQIRELLVRENPTHVLNLIGAYGSPDWDALFASNVQVSRSIFESAGSIPWAPEKILVVGSAAEYGFPDINPIPETAPLNPVSPYGLTKSLQTALAQYHHRASGLPTVVARPFNIVGAGLPTRLSIGHFMAQISAAEDGGAIRVGNIETYRDFLSVEAIAMGLLDLLFHGIPGEVYNLCSGVPQKIGDLLDQLIRASGKRLRVEVDASLYRANDVQSVYGDPSKLNALLRTK